MLSNPSIFSEKCLTVFGAGHFLLVGETASEYAASLRQNSIPANDIKQLPAEPAQWKNLLTKEQSATATIVLLHILNKTRLEEIEQIIHILDQTPLCAICLVADTTQTVDGTLRDTAWWQTRFFSAGFRQHPRAFLMLDYISREYPFAATILCFEKMPEQARIRYPLEYLNKERMLHMDMLRDPGRRSDAHLVRYVMAAPYIRPGDTVLDCACGLGYGAHILYQNSRAKQVIGMDFSESAVTYATHNYGIPGILDFFQGDVQNLSQLEDNSIDFITSFGIINHLPEPARHLKELARILRPSGRVMFSAPDKWVDETGKDPNPCHVYTWKKLYQEVTEHFIPDKGFIQIAGGGLRLPNGKRHWEEVPCEPIMDKEAEWVLLLAMKNPLSGKDVPYMETTFPNTTNPDYHVGAFGKSYLNPWLLKGMISIAFRLFNKRELGKLQQAVLENYPPDSADYGAALCGMGYQLLENAASSQAQIDVFMGKTAQYIALENITPCIMRWQVSLLFVAALLQQSMGNFTSAEELFSRCANYDVAPYSPLLGNKTLKALYNVALFALSRNNIPLAGQCLRRTLTEAQRLLQGSWLNIILSAETPFEPGPYECAELLSLASRCCYMLDELKTAEQRPGLVFSMRTDWKEWQLNYYRHATEQYQIANENLQNNLHSISNIKQKLSRILPPGSMRYALARAIWRFAKRCFQ